MRCLLENVATQSLGIANPTFIEEEFMVQPEMTKYSSILSRGNDEPPPAPFLRMLIIGLIVVSPSFLSGMSISYTTIALPEMNLKLDDATWFGSVGAIAAPIGTLIVGLIIDRFGRKTSLIFGIVPSVIGWFFLYWQPNTAALLLGQFMHGLTPGAVGYPSQVYVGECVMMSCIWLRNSCMMWIGLLMSMGMTLLFVLSIFLDYHQVCGVATAVSIIVGLVFCYAIPESPAWLYGRGRTGDAEWAEKKLGISQPILRQEKSETILSVETTSPVQWSGFKNEFAKIRRKDVYKSLIMSLVLSIAVPLGGTSAVLVYMISILNNEPPGRSDTTTTTTPVPSPQTITSTSSPLNSSSFSYEIYNNSAPSAGVDIVALEGATTEPSEGLNANLSSAISGILMVIATFIASILLPYIGFKKCLMLAQLGVAVGMLLLTYTDPNGIDPNLLFVHNVAVWMIIFLFGIITSAILTLAGDLFPTDAKGFASVGATISAATAFFVVKLHPYIYIAAGWYLFCGYAVVNVSCAIFIHFCLPEVVGKTLEEINEELNR